MSLCGIESCLTLNCEDLRDLGGLNDKVWLFNINNDAGRVSYTESGNVVSAINLPTYSGLYTLQNAIDGASGGYEMIPNEGGNKFYQHNVGIKTFANDGDKLKLLQDLLNSKVGVIVVDNNQKIKLYGQLNGVSVTEQTQNSGNGIANDVTDTIALTGGEKDMPKFVDNGSGFDSTIAYLESLEICA